MAKKEEARLLQGERTAGMVECVSPQQRYQALGSCKIQVGSFADMQFSVHGEKPSAYFKCMPCVTSSRGRPGFNGLLVSKNATSSAKRIETRLLGNGEISAKMSRGITAF